MSDLDKKVVAGLLNAPLPVLPFPPPRLASRDRRNRFVCKCCGNVRIASAHPNNVCGICAWAKCTTETPGANCPHKMSETHLSIAAATHTPRHSNIDIASGNGSNERDDDAMLADDKVMLEILAWRDWDASEIRTAYARTQGVKLSEYSCPLPQPLTRANGSYLMLHHQILTEKGWYYEHLEGCDPLLAYLGREEGIRTFYAAAIVTNEVTPGPAQYGPYGDDRHNLPRAMQDVIDKIGEKIGLEALAQFEIGLSFLNPRDDDGVVLIHRCQSLIQYILDLQGLLYAQEDEAMPILNLPDYELQTVMRLWKRVQEELREYEVLLSGRKRISKAHATAALLIKEYLDRIPRYIQDLIVPDL